MSKRIYIVTPQKELSIDKISQKPVLVRASTQSQAARHVTRDLYSVAVADGEDIVKLLSDGAKVQDAGEGD